LIADIIPDFNLCLLYSFVLFSNFWAAVSAFALLSCSTVHVAALLLYWFIEQINDDDDDDDYYSVLCSPLVALH